MKTIIVLLILDTNGKFWFRLFKSLYLSPLQEGHKIDHGVVEKSYINTGCFNRTFHSIEIESDNPIQILEVDVRTIDETLTKKSCMKQFVDCFNYIDYQERIHFTLTDEDWCTE